MEEEELNENINDNKPPKTKKQKTKKPLTFSGFMLRIFLGFVAIIIAICTFTGLFLHFKFDINAFELIKQITVLNKKVEENSFVTNNFSESDSVSFETKLQSFGTTEDATFFSDKEIASYIKENLTSNLSDNQTKIENILCGDFSEFVQLDFYNTNKSKNDAHLTNVNLVFKLDITNFKNENSQQFPMNVICNVIPDIIYVSIDFSISRQQEVTDGKTYQINYTSIKINSLSNADSESLLSAINSFYKIGSPQELVFEIGTIVADKLIGNEENEGIYYALTNQGAMCYSFYSNKEDDYFIIYKNDPNVEATITYNNLKSATNNNLTKYTILDNLITLNKLSLNGYNFLGWFDGESSSAKKIDEIFAWELDNVNLFAKWQIIEYKIEYVMRGGILDEGKENPTTYTIESVFTLNNPYKTAETPFLGWTGTNITEPQMNVTIQNCYGDLEFSARFEDDERALLLYIGDDRIGETVIVINDVINEVEVNEKADEYIKDNLPGYIVDKWYTDKELTKEYNFSTKVTDDCNLYAGIDYMVKELSFYPYIDTFEKAVKQKSITLNTRDEFAAFFEYLSFYLITERVTLKITYLQNVTQFENEINDIKSSFSWNMYPYYELQYGMLFTFSNSITVPINIVPSFWHNGGTLETIDPMKQKVNPQEDYALALNEPNSRTDDFDDFKINDVSKTLEVEHSWQLVYCLEQGFKPICKPNSGAEIIYNKAKSILRDICDDSMNDFEKIRAMYEWLIFNVNYDQKALSIAEQNGFLSSKLSKYDSWYPEGVFNKGVAVCEGYAKAFIILSRIEGIPMIYVSGNQHAWNRVYLSGNWYGIDATQGDLQFTIVSSNNAEQTFEVLDNRNYLFTDSYKSGLGYTSNDYKEFKAETVYNYYKNTTFSINGVKFDLHCEKSSEMYTLLNTIKKYVTTNNINGYTFEFEIDNSISVQSAINAVCAVFLIDSVLASNKKTVEGYNCILFYIDV